MAVCLRHDFKYIGKADTLIIHYSSLIIHLKNAERIFKK